MDIIQSSFSYSNLPIGQTTKPQKPQATGGDFDALLASFNTGAASRTENSRATSILGANNISGFIDELLESIHGSQGNSSAADLLAGAQFPFSSAFESTFGLSGPLPSFITMITSKLGLNAQQNLALQAISVNNKDATKSQESIQKIAQELRAAGIYA